MPQLILSEYVEGGSNNKAVEVYNAGLQPALAGRCALRFYFNGADAPGAPIAFELGAVLLPAGGTYVVCDDSSAADLLAVCDQQSGSAWFNGDDAIDLICDDTVIDIFGQIGLDPGSRWEGGDVTTQNRTLRRKCGVAQGDLVGDDAFDPSVEWDGLPQDTFDGLGSHQAACL